jgi:uncharacterized protein with NAD-binding domain and iron-sulfur cluster
MPKKIVILGGGVAGLSAAHELVERGFAVEVYETKHIPGGKARSIGAPGTGTGGRKDLPGEHGFRFFPRFYKHVVDTMGRIPYGHGHTVADNLVDTTRIELARFDQERIVLPSRSPRSLGDAKVVLDDFAELFDPGLGISHSEMAFFAARIWQIITSCQERRMNEYERIGWWEFIGAEERSVAYQKFLGHGVTRSLVAAKAQLASTKTIGDIFVQLLFDIAEPGTSSDRVLNGPTNEVWIEPWLKYLRTRGVDYHLEARVRSIHCENGRIQSVSIEKNGATTTVQGDYYLSAIPVERMADMLTPSLLAADPGLAGIPKLRDGGVSWMNGIQLYLTRDVKITHGHTIFIDSQWALTSVSQAQFWPDFDLGQYGDGSIKGVLSIDISEWEKPGLNGKTAKECSREEIQTEVWEQLKRSLNIGGQTLLRDEDLHEWFLDPDIHRNVMGLEVDEEPLLVNLINSWQLRPEAVTRIPNLFLASDYVRTYTDLATMEAANEAARRAVNGILDHAGVAAPKCRLWQLHEPEIFAPWRAIDQARYRQGLPWDDSLVNLGLKTLDMAETGITRLGRSLADARIDPRFLSGLLGGLGKSSAAAGTPHRSRSGRVRIIPQ